MAGGQKINDYKGMPNTSDKLMKSKNYVKEIHSAEGAGAEHEYEDTNEEIVKTQKHAASKAKSDSLKSGYRN